MKVVLAGAYGNLGSDILRELLKEGHEVVAADLVKRNVKIKGHYKSWKLDVTKPATIKGLCEGADCIISTVGLTKTSAILDNYQIDYEGNLNLLKEAKAAGVKQFVYISVLKADAAKDVPMLHAKYLFEQELIKSGLQYVIFRPSGYFYDIVKVFRPMIEKGKVTLLGRKAVHANVIATEDFAEYIVAHMQDRNQVYDIGGKETYSYEEIARMCFEAAGKPAKIGHAPAVLFDILAMMNRRKKNGKEAVIKFSKLTLTEDMVGSVKYGSQSFREYVGKSFKTKEE